MIKLSNYIDFITSLVGMDEVKEGNFKLPDSLTFTLDTMNHILLHREVLEAKEMEVLSDDELKGPFEIDVLDIKLKFE